MKELLDGLSIGYDAAFVYLEEKIVSAVEVVLSNYWLCSTDFNQGVRECYDTFAVEMSGYVDLLQRCNDEVSNYKLEMLSHDYVYMATEALVRHVLTYLGMVVGKIPFSVDEYERFSTQYDYLLTVSIPQGR